jgi:hypothetical protein
MFRAGTGMTTISRREGPYLAQLSTHIKRKRQSDHACNAGSNLNLPINYHSDISYFEKINFGKGLQIFFVCAQVLLESVIVTEFQATEAYSSFDPTKAKYSINRLPKVEKERMILRINPSKFIASEKRELTI